jgi:hypothetical protein
VRQQFALPVSGQRTGSVGHRAEGDGGLRGWLSVVVRRLRQRQGTWFMPSDFPQANLGQHDLDRLISKIG